VVETESVVKKGDLFELPVNDDTEACEVEQELAKCDDVIKFRIASEPQNGCVPVMYSTAFDSIEEIKKSALYYATIKQDLNVRIESGKMVRYYDEKNGFTGVKFVCDKVAMEHPPTVTYIAKPENEKCSWWCVQVPDNQQLDGHRINAPFLKRGADLELRFGDMLIDSEANHPRKNRGGMG